ncbi:MAG: preprotein translocase subunit SecG [Candidatus Acidiferrales bacterium]
MPSWMKWTIALLIGFVIIVVGFRWFSWLLTSFFVLNCLVLMIVVLLQSGKAADLAGAFGGAGSQTAFGPRGAASILSQATTWCAVMFMICAFAMVLRTDKAVEQGGGSVLQEISKPAPAKTPATTPGTPTPVPQTSTPQNNPPASNALPASSKPAAQQPAPTQPKKP